MKTDNKVNVKPKRKEKLLLKEVAKQEKTEEIILQESLEI